jgi:glycosyltransferase involved in cell wall biosynthesis
MHVTVILSAYNGEATIDAAVESIVAQTYSDWDMILIDDASTDGTGAKLDAWAARDRRIAAIHNERNLGLAASLNLGWRRARGELIARMDADDVSAPDRIERQLAFLREHPEVDVLGTAASLVGEDARPMGTITPAATHEELVAHMYRKMPFMHSSVVMRRRFLETLGGYDEQLRRSQDFDLWARGHHQFRYANLPEPLIRYTTRHQPAFRSILYATWVAWRAVVRDRRILSQGWWPIRWFLAMTAARLGVWRLRNR